MGTTSSGYPRRTLDRKQYMVHTAIWEELNGPVPDDMDLHHVCKNKMCFNPRHLMAIGKFAHMFIHGGDGPARTKLLQTHCVHGHEFNAENTYINRFSASSMERRCKACNRNRQQSRRYLRK